MYGDLVSTENSKAGFRQLLRPVWPWLVPALAWVVIALLSPATLVGFIISAAALLGGVFAAVHHAETIAHRVGEPFGSIILALAVTVIEVGLIVSIMLSANIAGESSLARDTVFATVMLVCNGVLGLCILVSGIRFHEPEFRPQAAGSYLAVLIVLATAVLVLPGFTQSAKGPVYTPSQLGFAATVSLGLYLVFLFVQTVRHRDTFLPVARGGDGTDSHDRPSGAATAFSAIVLPLALGAIVLLAKHLAPELETALRKTSIAEPAAVVGVIVAALVLLPETLSALNAARGDRLQTSVNLSLGSALASIALTIPAVAAVSLWTGEPLILGLGGTNLILLGMTFVVATLTLGTGRATILQGAVHLVILALFLFLAVVP